MADAWHGHVPGGCYAVRMMHRSLNVFGGSREVKGQACHLLAVLLAPIAAD